MKCSKCGKELTQNDRFCPECGQKVEIPVAKPEEKRIVSSMENSTFLCIISLVCYFGWPILAGIIGVIGAAIPPLEILEGVVGLLPLAGFVLAIVAWAKYPKTTFPKVLVIVYIVLFILLIFLLIIFATACVSIFKEIIETGAILNLWL